MAPEEKNENIKKDENKTPSKQNQESPKINEGEQNNEIFFSQEKSFEEISEHEIFAGDQDFYKLLSDSFEESIKDEKPAKRNLVRKEHRNPTILWIQRILIAGIITTAVTMSYAILKTKLGIFQGPAMTNGSQMETVSPNSVSLISDSSAKQENLDETQVLPAGQAVSLEVARKYFSQKQYKQAYHVYKKLYESFPESDELLKDYLHLEMALCSENSKDLEEAYNLLTLVSESRSPAVRIISNYHLCLIEIQRKRYLRARTRAYKALALFKSTDFKDDWEMAFECDCNYLVCQCLTYYVLSLSNTSDSLPEDLSGESMAFDDPTGKA